MTEKLTVENGRLKVERIEGKESLDLDLSAVDAVRFEAAQFEGYSGALVLTVDGEEKVVRVDNEDAPAILEKVEPAVGRREAAGTSTETPGGEDAPTPEPEDQSASTPTRKRSQRS